MQAQDTRGVEAALTSLSGRVADLKKSISALLVKLELENHNWPSILDNFTALSGHISTLLKQLKNDKTPPLQNVVILPLEIRSEHDKHLDEMTEGRVPIFHHEIVPDYLRTKFDLSLEQHTQSVLEKAAMANTTPADSKAKVQSLNTACNALLDVITAAREDWAEASASAPTAAKQAEVDTAKLVAAMVPAGVPSIPAPKGGKGAGSHGRAQSSVKTDVKAASAAAGHPYSRTGR